MQKPIFVNNGIYHIYNRGVEKRKVFTNNKDYLRFIHDLFEFNDESPVLNIGRDFTSKVPMNEVELQSLKSLEHSLIKDKHSRKLLVEILIFTLMPNHFHLLLKQRVENGIVRFMQKLGTGYTNYFNTKYQRVGSLFQGRFKAVKIEEHSHFLHLPYYIHSNPLNLLNEGSSTSFIEEYYRH